VERGNPATFQELLLPQRTTARIQNLQLIRKLQKTAFKLWLTPLNAISYFRRYKFLKGIEFLRGGGWPS
jgi:hypothetical protein